MKPVATEQTRASPTVLPATSLTICSRNRPTLLADTVESILQGDEVPAELVIIDQSAEPHPTLATGKHACGCDIRYHQTHSVGLGRARNAGFAAARYEIVALTDDDMLAPPTWFGSLIGALRNAGPKGVVTGQVLPAPAETTGGFAPSTKIDETPAVYAGRVGKDVLYTGNMALHRSAIDTVGGFDERLGAGAAFPAADDNDWGFRLLEAGYRIIYVPEAALYHRAWRSDREYLRLRWNYGRGQGGYYAKYVSLRDPYMLQRFIRDIIRQFVRCARRIRHQRSKAYGDAVYAFGMLWGATQWLLTQRKTS